MEITCNAHQPGWIVDKKSELRVPCPPYPVREKHQLPARERYARHVVERRRRKLASQSFSRLAAEVQALGLAKMRQNAWLRSAENTLSHFEKLESNWDGYGASPIDPAVIQESRHLIARIAAQIEEPPVIVPTSRGGVQLEWHHGGRCLELEFESHVMIHYLKWDPTSRIEEEDFVTIYDEGKIARLLEWLEKN